PHMYAVRRCGAIGRIGPQRALDHCELSCCRLELVQHAPPPPGMRMGNHTLSSRSTNTSRAPPTSLSTRSRGNSVNVLVRGLSMPTISAFSSLYQTFPFE